MTAVLLCDASEKLRKRSLAVEIINKMLSFSLFFFTILLQFLKWKYDNQINLCFHSPVTFYSKMTLCWRNKNVFFWITFLNKLCFMKWWGQKCQKFDIFSFIWFHIFTTIPYSSLDMSLHRVKQFLIQKQNKQNRGCLEFEKINKKNRQALKRWINTSFLLFKNKQTK